MHAGLGKAVPVCICIDMAYNSLLTHFVSYLLPHFLHTLQAELASARTGLRAAEEALDRRTAELKKAQAAAAAGGGSEEAAHMLRK